MSGYKYAYLYDEVGLTETYFGRKILVNTRNIYTYNIITNGVIEKAICHYLEGVLKTGDHVIDVGANIGFLTLLSAHLVKNKGRVDAFEANPVVFEKLSENIVMNGFQGFVTSHNNAVFNEARTLEFTWNKYRDGSGRIVTKRQSNHAEKTVEIEAIALDDMFQDRPVDLIKIDTEGSEPYVLEGAKKTISNNPNIKVIFEWNKKHIKQRDADPQAAVDFVFSRFKHVKKFVGFQHMEELTPESMMDLSHSNLLAHN